MKITDVRVVMNISNLYLVGISDYAQFTGIFFSTLGRGPKAFKIGKISVVKLNFVNLLYR